MTTTQHTIGWHLERLIAAEPADDGSEYLRGRRDGLRALQEAITADLRLPSLAQYSTPAREHLTRWRAEADKMARAPQWAEDAYLRGQSDVYYRAESSYDRTVIHTCPEPPYCDPVELSADERAAVPETAIQIAETTRLLTWGQLDALEVHCLPGRGVHPARASTEATYLVRKQLRGTALSTAAEKLRAPALALSAHGGGPRSGKAWEVAQSVLMALLAGDRLAEQYHTPVLRQWTEAGLTLPTS
jgi:hypothetical protein